MPGDFASRPRLFIRRCLAFAFDYLFVAFLLSVGIAALSAILPSNPTLNGGINTRVCKVLPEDAELRRYMSFFPDIYQEKPARFVHCTRTDFFVVKSRTLNVFLTAENASQTDPNLSVSIPVDENGNITGTWPAGDWINVLLPFLLALSTTLWGNTLGKRFLSLRLVTQKTEISVIDYLWREYLRFLPIVAISLFELIRHYSTNSGVLDPIEVQNLIIDMNGAEFWNHSFAVGMLLFLVFASYYLVPLMRWRGRMPYDSWSGFEGVRRA